MKKYFVCFILLVMTGCGIKIGSSSLEIKQDLVVNNYDTLRKIVIEEAKNNGFNELTSEIKPSKYNEQQGRLFFSLKTPNGTDQLFVDFDNGNIKMHGAGTRSNPESAIKAIRQRFYELNESYGFNNSKAKNKNNEASIPSETNDIQQQQNKSPKATQVQQSGIKTEAISSRPLSVPSEMIVISSKARLRKKPSTKAAEVTKLKKGEKVQIIKQNGDWFQVELASGDVGWCHKTVISKQN